MGPFRVEQTRPFVASIQHALQNCHWVAGEHLLDWSSTLTVARMVRGVWP